MLRGIVDAATVTGLVWLAVAAALFVLVSSSVVLGLLSLWMNETRRGHALQVLDRFVDLTAALRGKAPPVTDPDSPPHLNR